MRFTFLPRLLVFSVILLVIGSASMAADASGSRKVVSLNGTWQVEEGKMESAPKKFTHTVAVPGLLDMAQPPFVEPGPRVGEKNRRSLQQKDPRRDAFWYRRTFRLEDPVPAVAALKIHKALYGARVILNGQVVGDHLPCFTPGTFDLRNVLKSGENELLIRVGADRDAVSAMVPSGRDYEKIRYIPGIYDSVELILSGTPHIVNVQAVPDIEKKSVTVVAWVRHTGPATGAKLHFTVREASTGQVAGQGDCEIPTAGDGTQQQGQAVIPIRNCRLWSPEDPFLYNLEVKGDADSLKTRFGMRTFRLDPATGRAVLNGRPYFMRGSNVCIFRFMEDEARKDLPWREEWIRRLHRNFKDMHWNCLRYCIGFPPESWYRIADEEGIMIQDEFPVWGQDDTGPVAELAAEYAEWMRERWNHPCVVIWDAQNETKCPTTGAAIARVRQLDRSNRPWDNGWSPAVDAADVYESHPYRHYEATYTLSHFAKDSGSPADNRSGGIGGPPGNHPIIVNEYGWLWLNRDGTPTTLTKTSYRRLLEPNATAAQRRHLYARYLAAETEFWRSHRRSAAVMHFCGLAYSRPDGQTSDHWLDVEKLAWEPEFYSYVRDAFAPVGLMIDAWAEKYPPGPGCKFPVVVINDLYDNWKGTVRFRLLRDGKTLVEQTQSCEVPPLGRKRIELAIDIPSQPARYQVEAALLSPRAKPVRSLRDFEVPKTQPNRH